MSNYIDIRELESTPEYKLLCKVSLRKKIGEIINRFGGQVFCVRHVRRVLELQGLDVNASTCRNTFNSIMNLLVANKEFKSVEPKLRRAIYYQKDLT